MRIGVLALQGDFAAHAAAIATAGGEAFAVRRVAELDGLHGLVIPGGESTTLLKLMDGERWFDALRALHGRGGSILGTCAGAILLAREVRRPSQPSVGLLDVVVERNGFGRQAESFETRIDVPEIGGSVDAVFIRAPRIVSTGDRVEVLARFGGEPVAVRQGRVLALTFHPELTGDVRLHRHFLEFTAEGRAAAGLARAAAC